jgi:uncharacterized membrane protein YvbJ
MANIKCPSCGSPNVEQIDVNKYQCPYCGRTFTTQEVAPVQQPPQFDDPQQFTPEVDDNPGCLMNGVCFLIPIVGLVLYFVKKPTQPNCAKSYLTWAAVGFIISIFIQLIAVMAS